MVSLVNHIVCVSTVLYMKLRPQNLRTCTATSVPSETWLVNKDRECISTFGPRFVLHIKKKKKRSINSNTNMMNVTCSNTTSKLAVILRSTMSSRKPAVGSTNKCCMNYQTPLQHLGSSKLWTSPLNTVVILWQNRGLWMEHMGSSRFLHYPLRKFLRYKWHAAYTAGSQEWMCITQQCNQQ